MEFHASRLPKAQPKGDLDESTMHSGDGNLERQDGLVAGKEGELDQHARDGTRRLHHELVLFTVISQRNIWGMASIQG